MARSTCDPNREAPKGMMKFEVIRSTIRDSVGQYCVPGDYAILTKKIAKGYLDKNFIRVALPEFDDADDDGKDEASEPPARADGDGESADEQASVEDASSTNRVPRRPRRSANA